MEMKDAIVQLAKIISKMAEILLSAIIVSLQSLLVILLGVLVVFFYALPWLLRAGSLLLWFYGIYRSVFLIHALYQPFTPPSPLMALDTFIALLQFGSLLVIFRLNPRLAWGALTLIGSFSLWFSTRLIPALINKTHAALVLRILPSVLWGGLLLFLTVRAKRRQMGQRVTFLDQAVVRLKIEEALAAIDAFGASLLATPEPDIEEGGGA